MIGELIISNNIKLVKAVSKYRLLKKFDNLNEEGSIVFRNMKTKYSKFYIYIVLKIVILLASNNFFKLMIYS